MRPAALVQQMTGRKRAELTTMEQTDTADDLRRQEAQTSDAVSAPPRRGHSGDKRQSVLHASLIAWLAVLASRTCAIGLASRIVPCKCLLDTAASALAGGHKAPIRCAGTSPALGVQRVAWLFSSKIRLELRHEPLILPRAVIDDRHGRRDHQTRGRADRVGRSRGGRHDRFAKREPVVGQ